MEVIAKQNPSLLHSTPVRQSDQHREVSFLLACLRPESTRGSLPPTQDSQPELRCPPDLDWSALLHLAENHGVSALLVQCLLNLDPTVLPVWVQTQLAAQQQRNAIKGLALLALLLKLWHLFTIAGVRVTTFKGPVFASEVYGNLKARVSVDIDLLVPFDQVMQARQILIDAGFKPQVDLTVDQLAYYARSFYALTFRNAQTGQSVDLHWSLLPPQFSFCPPPEWVWKQLTSISVSGQVITTLSPECLLLYLCVHSAKENWCQLRYFVDLAALLARYPQLNWDWIWANVEQLGNRRMLNLGLYLTHVMFGVDLPEICVTQIKADPTLPKLADWVVAELFPAPENHKFLLDQISTFNRNLIVFYSVLFYQSLDCWSDRWQFFQFFFSPQLPEYELLQLSPPWMFLYPPFRFIRLAHKYILGR